MKGKKPTYTERKILSSKGMDTYEWLVQKSTPKYLQVVNRNTNEERVIEKEDVAEI